MSGFLVQTWFRCLTCPRSPVASAVFPSGPLWCLIIWECAVHVSSVRRCLVLRGADCNRRCHADWLGHQRQQVPQLCGCIFKYLPHQETTFSFLFMTLCVFLGFLPSSNPWVTFYGKLTKITCPLTVVFDGMACICFEPKALNYSAHVWKAVVSLTFIP